MTKKENKKIKYFDKEIMISAEEMKSQMDYTYDTVTPLAVAPPTKQLMFWLETSGVEKVFSIPGQMFLSDHLVQLIRRNMFPFQEKDEDLSNDKCRIDLDEKPNPENRKRKVIGYSGCSAKDTKQIKKEPGSEYQHSINKQAVCEYDSKEKENCSYQFHSIIKIEPTD